MSMGREVRMKSSHWSDLPSELLSIISERLDPIELLSFRSVCKAWNSASSTASAKIESTPNFEPWFLLYGEDGNDSVECRLVNESGKKFSMSLPELKGTTCLASSQGWLLLFKQAQGDQGLEAQGGNNGGGSSMFFFRPFSKTKIDLPASPFSKLSDHVAAFSCPPTSQDCTVCVMNRVSADELKLNVLRRGTNEWIQRDIRGSRTQINTIKCAAYSTYRQEFYFFDHRYGMLVVDTNKNPLSWTVTRNVPAAHTECGSGIYFLEESYFKDTGMKRKLGLAADEDASFSTCGTQSQFEGMDKFIYNETITGNRVEGSKKRRFRAVWIYPKFYQAPPKGQTW